MNALISASDIKTFYSALHCLGRFSETFWLQCSPRTNGQAHIRLSAINPTNSAFCMFAFDPDFFLNVSTSRQKIECQIQLKTILSILRGRGRNVERLELSLTDDSPECRFSLTLHCHHSILKTHNLTYSPKRGLLPTADPNPPNFFCINASTASEWLDHFLSSSRTGEISLVCTPDSCIARSKEEEMPEARGQVRKAIATEVKVAVDEFKDYCVLEECKLTFSLREFKATVGLAESLGVPLEVNFSDGDEPLFVRLRVENAVAAEFVIATTKADRTTNAAGGVNGDAGQTRASAPPPAPPPAPPQQPEPAARIAASASSSTTLAPPRPSAPSRLPSNHSPEADSSSSLLSHPNPNPASKPHQTAIPNQSTPLPNPPTPPQPPDAEDDQDETQPLFFPGGASQLSLNPTPTSPGSGPEVTFVRPTPVAQGGDPSEFLAPPSSLSATGSSSQEHPEHVPRSDSDSDTDRETRDGPRKRFKPLF